jgi:preprotein translocase subunit SecD
MFKSLKWRALLVLALTVVSLVYLFPTFFEMPSWWKEHLPDDKVSLGLDLQGGMHLVLEVQANKAVETALDRMAGDIREILTEEKIPYGQLERQGADKLLVEILDPSTKDKFNEVLENKLSTLDKVKVDESAQGIKFELMIKPKEAEHIKKLAVDQCLETIRNRVDQFGVAEPTIQKQGEDQILVQLPGIRDPKRAIELIGKTALLEFKLVDEENNLEKALKGEIPPDSEILYQKHENKETGEVSRVPYLLKKTTLLTGEYLTSAQVRIESQFNEPYVGIDFSDIGGKLFERITAANVKKRLAIILDNNVYSAPVIQEKISGGSAQITGRFTEDEARDLAIVLRAGSLKAPVKIIEKRTVGPSLGKDSIDQGLRSCIVGSILVVLFMLFYYRLSGAVANFSLIFNIILLLAGMAAFKSTLTLPGIAGIVLTIGMAVDANVLIFERTREEIRAGKTPRAAIDAGYSKALITIVDAQLTTIIAAIFLFQFGTGPIKGFAVTLTIGLIASLFTSIYVTRLIFDYFLIERRIKSLSI